MHTSFFNAAFHSTWRPSTLPLVASIGCPAAEPPRSGRSIPRCGLTALPQRRWVSERPCTANRVELLTSQKHLSTT